MQEMVSQHVRNSPLNVDNPCWYHALTLTERLASLQAQRSAGGTQTPYDSELAARKLAEWQKQDAFSKGISFAQRLEADHFVEEDLLVLLGEPITAVQQRTPPPEWLLQLADVFVEHNLLQPGQLSFFNIFDIFSIYAHNRLTRLATALQTEYNYLPFDPSTIANAFLPNLLTLIAPVINRTLLLELNVARLQGLLHGATPEELIQAFIQHMRNTQKLQLFLEEYPVLARQIIIIINGWLNDSLDLLRHLCSDWRQICAIFSPEKDPGLLIEALGASHDGHRGGHGALTLRFSSDLQLLYKPKSLAIDLHFQEVLTWLNEQGYQPSFRTMKLLPGKGYGWSEYVETSACTTASDVERFYERQGGYLALLYVLGATNFHHENLIASGEHPIVLDMDFLLHSRSKNTLDLDAAIDVAHFSALRVGMLPMRIAFKNAQQNPDASTNQTQLNWLHRPTLNGAAVDPLAYEHSMIAGFRRMYLLLMTHHQTVTSSLLARFADDEITCTFRPTNFYNHILHESFHPDLLRDALDRDRHFDHLWQAAKFQPELIQVIRYERSDLLACTIPRFITHPNTSAIFSSNANRIIDFLEQPGLTVAQQTVLQLQADDLERQCWFIQASFSSWHLGKGQPQWKQSSVTLPSGKLVTRERLLTAACQIGDRLCTLASGDWRGINWVGVTNNHQGQWFFTPAMPDLYDGNAGIIFFLSYLGIITGNTRYSDIAEQAYITMYKQLERFEARMQPGGIFEGLGSIIYLLSHLGTIWNDPTLHAEAHWLTKRLPDLLQKDTPLDLINGSAGCILSLLSLYQVSPKPEILATARMYGDHLHTKVQQIRENSANGEPPVNIAYGTSGYILSLLTLAAISSEARFHNFALAMLTYERSLLQAQRVPLSTNSGIGLARLAFLPYVDDEQIREEISTVLKTTVASFGGNHSLNNGDLGKLETLLVATRILHDPWCHEQFNYFRGSILDSIETDGWLTGVPFSIETPGLMTGLAGIGYELLRLAEPERVPSVLVAAPPITKKVR